jgi:CBS domain-containing protein
MGTVREILAKKGTQVWTIGKSATVLQAALLMNEHRIGALVVLEADRVTGVFSERDVLQRVVAGQRDPARTSVADVMTSDVVCGTLDTSIEEARGAMMNRRIRHLPLVDDDRRLLGLVSIGDLNAYQADGQEQTIHMLHEYLYGRT